jgi:hypothetical protein
MLESVNEGETSLYDLDEEGSIFIEKNNDLFVLCAGEVHIHLDEEYEITENKVTQNEMGVVFDTPSQFEYFKKTLKEIQNENR